MGCCCSSEDNANANDGFNERERLINGGNSRAQIIEPTAGEYQRTSSVHKKNDEQSALNRILHKAASNVIDVAALDTHGMEQHEFGERAKAYSQKLATASVKLRGKKREPLPEMSLSVDRLITLPPLASADVELIVNLSKNMEEGYRMFAVHHEEDLIVHFAMT